MDIIDFLNETITLPIKSEKCFEDVYQDCIDQLLKDFSSVEIKPSWTVDKDKIIALIKE